MSRILIDTGHVTRVEGHGRILVRASDGKIQQCQWIVNEAPRLFEALVRGRHFEDIQLVVSRICGICSITHSFAATKAIESAFGIEVTPQTDTLRILLHNSEQVQSHLLHIGYLALPDFFNAHSVVPLAKDNADLARKIISIHRFANRWSELMGGRQTHPLTIKPGGFTMIPRNEELASLAGDMQTALNDALALADTLCRLIDKLPAFERPTEYVSLVQSDPPTYTFYHGQIGSTESPSRVDVCNWPQVLKEYIVPQSTAKWVRWNKDTYAVGSLARYNNNAHLLSPAARKMAGLLGLARPCYKPFMNTFAQYLEVIHLLETSAMLIDDLLTKGMKRIEDEDIRVIPRQGSGTGCVEAPRGILFHSYEFDKKGFCVGANCCIPTNQNHANIQRDFESFVPMYLDLGQENLRFALEMLVRAYDPCISCSTHMIRVEFV
jgi:coenzyme F420-reducing hydrogenase alpha subunit